MTLSLRQSDRQVKVSRPENKIRRVNVTYLKPLLKRDQCRDLSQY